MAGKINEKAAHFCCLITEEDPVLKETGKNGFRTLYFEIVVTDLVESGMSHPDAEDVASAVISRCITLIEGSRYEEQGQCTAWVKKIRRGVASDWRKRIGRQKRGGDCPHISLDHPTDCYNSDSPTIGDLIPCPVASPEQPVIWAEEEEAIHTLFDGLSETEKECFTLKFLVGWKIKDIARDLNMKPNTVTQTVNRALEKVRAKIVRYLSSLVKGLRDRQEKEVMMYFLGCDTSQNGPGQIIAELGYIPRFLRRTALAAKKKLLRSIWANETYLATFAEGYLYRLLRDVERSNDPIEEVYERLDPIEKPLYSFVEELPEPECGIFKMFLDDTSLDKIAERIGRRLEEVREIIDRAIKRFVKIISRHIDPIKAKEVEKYLLGKLAWESELF